MNLMTQAQSCPSVGRYEATVSTGLEKIAQGEIIERLGATKTETTKGRVLLESDRPIDDILKLKSVNNIFVIIHEEYIDEQKMPQDSEQLESLLMDIGDKCDWRLGLTKWKEKTNYNTCKFEELFIKDSQLRDSQPSFRVSSNRYGPNHKFTSPEICSTFGHVVDTKFGWPIRMKNFDLEIYVNISENHLYVTLTLTPITLACRNIIDTGYTTLKAATCYALLRVADVQLGDIVIDPMAGSGAIPVENMAAWNDWDWLAFTLCADLTEGILAKSRNNMKAISGEDRNPPADLMQSDIRTCPLKNESIDVVVTDLPFGHRHGSKSINRLLYPKMMVELSRITRLNTGRAVFLTQDFKSMNLAFDRCKDYWTQDLCNFVKVGNLNCWIYLYRRTSKPFA